MTPPPKVTIGLPVRNGEAFLVQAIESLLQQDFVDFELIISDNGSEDKTEEICRHYEERDARIRYYRFDLNQGAARNYNKVFEVARGKYFKWASHDDICLPGMLGKCVEVLDQDDSTVLTYARTMIIDEEGRSTRQDSTCLEARHRHAYRRVAHVLQHLSLATPIFGVIRADALRQTRLIDAFVGSDEVLLVELAILGHIREVPEILFQRRIYPGTSRRANPTKEMTLAWYNPKRSASKERLSIPMRLLLEYLRSASQMRASGLERIMCYMVIPFVFYWKRFRNWGGAQRQRIKRFIVRR